jgi:hypothetical protein
LVKLSIQGFVESSDPSAAEDDVIRQKSDPQLHARCVASFNRDEPSTGSPTPVPRAQQREAR